MIAEQYLGEQGAEQLIGKGDMLFMSSANRINRIHGPYVSEKEIEKITSVLRAQGEPDYIEEITYDDKIKMTTSCFSEMSLTNYIQKLWILLSRKERPLQVFYKENFRLAIIEQQELLIRWRRKE